ncbi:hypothetical protein AAVH_43368, partial [Aphelenchoides avenae]
MESDLDDKSKIFRNFPRGLEGNSPKGPAFGLPRVRPRGLESDSKELLEDGLGVGLGLK